MNSILFISAILLFVSASAKQYRAKSVKGWKKISLASPHAQVTVGFVIHQNNLDIIDYIFESVSEPSSPEYGQYLTKDQVRELTFDLESVSRTIEFLTAHGFSEIEGTSDGDYVKAKVSVAKASELFGATFYEYGHSARNQTIFKTESFSTPEDLKDAVVHIAHLSHFPEIAPRRMVSASYSGNTIPSLVKSEYGISSNKCETSKSSQSLFESLGQQFSPSDLSHFQEKFNLQNETVFKIVGSNDGSACTSDDDNCAEANLDVQYMMGIAQNCETWYWSISDDEDPFIAWAHQVTDTENPPLVHSISYGGDESSEQDTSAFNNQMKKLGIRGVTVFVSSGDDGVSGAATRSDQSACGYSPSFPATSPYVTAVGATQGPEEGKPEISCSSDTDGLITSGGGFSGAFRRPSWQKEAVSAYLETAGKKAVSGYNREGRGYPDVSALGHNYIILDGGDEIVVSGTSASSPVFASMITLINDARIAAGKPPLGFLNKALYSLPASVFNDITEGENKCAAAHNNPTCCTQGFSAAKGWDPVTGLGTPKFDALKEALMKL